MKMLFPAIFFILTLPCFSQTSTGDTTIQGILVSFSYSSSIFPPDWQASPINVKGDAIDATEISRSKSVMAKALKKYPLVVLQKDLKSVYFLKRIEFYNLGHGATNSTDALYLTNNGIKEAYTNLYLEQAFHHEFSSILYRNHSSFFDEAGWLNANSSGFNYNDPEDGVGAIRNHQSSQDLDTVLCAKGFLTQYSLSGIENDINTFAQNIFSPSENFWLYVDHYSRIQLKTKLLIAFYNKIDPFFTENYFRKLAR